MAAKAANVLGTTATVTEKKGENLIDLDASNKPDT